MYGDTLLYIYKYYYLIDKIYMYKFSIKTSMKWDSEYNYGVY